VSDSFGGVNESEYQKLDVDRREVLLGTKGESIKHSNQNMYSFLYLLPYPTMGHLQSQRQSLPVLPESQLL
jgi:hypothetical protein